MILRPTRKPISSQASAGGRSRLKWQVGPKGVRCGQALVPANLSAPQASAEAQQMSGTSGPYGYHSSPHDALQRSLENRLRARMAAYGSPEYVLTWKHWDMPSGPPICALRASGRRISGSDCSGWPTPETRMYRDLSPNGQAYAASRARHQPSTVTTAYLRGYTTDQIPALLAHIMGYSDLWAQCAASVMPLSRKSRRNS